MASSEADQTKPPSRRDRAFLGQLPDDFLRAEPVTALQRPARYCVSEFVVFCVRVTVYRCTFVPVFSILFGHCTLEL